MDRLPPLETWEYVHARAEDGNYDHPDVMYQHWVPANQPLAQHSIEVLFFPLGWLHRIRAMGAAFKMRPLQFEGLRDVGMPLNPGTAIRQSGHYIVSVWIDDYFSQPFELLEIVYSYDDASRVLCGWRDSKIKELQEMMG